MCEVRYQQPTLSHDPASASVFEATIAALNEDVFNELPAITYEGIYQYCCQDAYSFKILARAHKHKDAGDIIDIKLCKVGMLTYYTYGLQLCPISGMPADYSRCDCYKCFHCCISHTDELKLIRMAIRYIRCIMLSVYKACCLYIVLQVTNTTVYVSSRCQTSMKNQKYKYYAAIETNGSITDGYCESPVGYDCIA